MQLSVRGLLSLGLLATALPATVCGANRSSMLRTVVTTDLEQDDLASLIRYLLYTNELDTQAIIYSSSRYHWSGDGNGTKFFLPDREYSSPQWAWRWTGTRTLQDKVLPAYAEIWPNLNNHDPAYPTPDELASLIKIGNINFEGEMELDTEGSDLIRSLILDDDSRTLYLQAWGGTNTIARALKSIEDEYSGGSQWNETRDAVVKKTVILASGFQDETYANYISLQWPQIRVEQLEPGYTTWGYNCNKGQGNTRGRSTGDNLYFTGKWMKAHIQTGPLGRLYRSWIDGQSMAGDAQDIFGSPATANQSAFCKALDPYAFLSEGDNVVFNPLLTTGLQNPANPSLGGWGGRSYQNSTSPNLWVMVSSEKNKAGVEVDDYTTDRWAGAAQNDFAARMQWTLTPKYSSANHHPSVTILNGTTVEAQAGTTVTPGNVTVTEVGDDQAEVEIPADAQTGETVSIIFEGTDDGHFPLTRYGRVFIRIV
ncbi:DUF1593 domain-containing protein [Aspergillus brunneoviolaceus CBS 621.78]|uniref:DUF1593-domain-containing protein n=1 Tax=Aspergillus brunneoviolaceus CBS 621.78 TaxID=1450534 RepID=A0ACD1FUC1_9EURO|nr:DUF1593-domain-containing protein [Aspergillus brunneoviolaceus CBS 621.78]RAH40602.1 DUF1593-domain-containing protein [Aspergillus brunneoviolaceus CBS 621.78]